MLYIFNPAANNFAVENNLSEDFKFNDIFKLKRIDVVPTLT